MREGSRANTLGTVILVTSIGLLLIFTTAGVGFFQLSFATGLEQRQQARNLAESALAYGIARVMQDEQYGKTRAPDDTILLPGPDKDSYGLLSFHEDTAHGRGTLYSTNNLEVGGGVAGDGRTVPRQMTHLVGFGKMGDQIYEAEVLLYRPPFPRTLASSGPIVSLGALKVAGVNSIQDYPGSVEAVPADKRLPGHLSSNSGVDPAVHLSSASDVSGDVQAVGSVLLDPGARVDGEVRPNGETQALPDIDIPNLIQRIKEVTKEPDLSSPQGDLAVDWFEGTSGDLTVTGNVEMKDGVLFVGRNLTIQGKVTGRGAIFVGGETRMEHGAELDGQSVIALASQGSVSLTGEERSSYYFHGLVYTEGNCTARNITVLGAMVANSPEGKGRLELENVNLVQAPVAVQVSYARPCTVTSGPERLPDDGGPPYTYIQAVPFDDENGARRFYLRIRCPARSFDQSWPAQPWAPGQPGLDLAAAKQVLRDVGDDVSHDEGVVRFGDEYLDGLAGTLSGNRDVLDVTFNNLMSELDRPRIMMWRRLR